MNELTPEKENKPPYTSKVVEHLIELRKRLLYCIYAITIVFAILFYFSNPLFDLIAHPLLKQLDHSGTMITTALTGTFVAPLKLTFFIALFVTMPFIFYQIWCFVAPGLYKKEKYMIWPLLLMSTILFYMGVLFAYFFVFPLLFKFFIAIAPSSITVTPDIANFIDLVLKLFFAFGFCFEVPIITVILICTNIVSLTTIKAIRPYVFVSAFIIGMLLTPPDVLSQILLAVPLYALFECGVLLAKLLLNKQEKKSLQAKNYS